MADESLIGKDLGTVTFPVERSKVREFARSLCEHDPMYTDVEVARAAGFENIPVPPTFVVSSAHWHESDDLIAALDMDSRRALHGESGWKYLGPVVVGDELTAKRRICDVTKREGKRGGTMTLVSVQTDFTNQRGELVVSQTDVIIETGA